MEVQVNKVWESTNFEILKDKDGNETRGVKCVFCTTGVVDHHEDRIVKGAIGNQDVVLSAYGHGSTRLGALPIGKGRVYEEGNKAIFEGEFFKSQEAVDTYETVKALGKLQEWSFSLHNMDYKFVNEDGRHIMEITKVEVGEVSPVLKGAGIGTRTISMKDYRHMARKFADESPAGNDERLKTLSEENEQLRTENTELKAREERYVSRIKGLSRLISLDGGAK